MKTKLLILFSILTWNSAFSQRQHIIDSLQQALHRVDSDSAKYFLLNDLLREYLEYKNDSALYYSERLIEMAEKNNWKLALADGLDYKGYILMNLGKYAESYRTLMKGKNIAENPANEAFDRYSPSDRTPYKSRIYALANIHHELGHLMGKVNNREKQKFHYLKAEELAIEIGDEELLGYVYMNLGGVYLRADNELDTALSMEMKALAIFSKQEDKKFMGTIYLNLGEIYERKKENKLALENFHKSLQIHKEVNHYQGMYLACSGLANFYLDGLNRDSSLYYSKKLGEIIRLYPTGLTENAILQYHTFLYKSYELNNQRDSAYKHLTLAHSMQDSFHQQEIKNLTNVQNLSFEEQLRAEQLKKEKAALQSRIKQYALFGGLGMVLLVAFFLYRNNRQKQKTNALLQAQNRELAIEAALERVRAQTMAMHNSEDVGRCIIKLFGELTGLGVSETTRCGIGIFNHDNGNMELWTASKDERGEVNINIGNLDMTTHPLLQSGRNAWMDKKNSNFYILEGEDLLVYFQTINAAPGYSVKFDIDNLPKRYFHYDFVFDQGILFAFSHEPLSDELSSIFQRFSSLFGQTYRRYLDLVKAEAQAREAQIEAALERVRARTMAMHKSGELAEVVALIYKEAKEFKLADWGCNIQIIDDTEETVELWISAGTHDYLPKPYYFHNTDHEDIKKQLDAFKKKENYTLHLQGEEKKSYDEFTLTHTDFKYFPEEMKAGIRAEDKVHFTAAFMKYGFIVSVNLTSPLSAEQFDLLSRFAKVFEQTYTRFLDLQKAEAQAREAEIQLALERIRARAMAMHSSSELAETSTILFEQLQELGIEVRRCGFGLPDDELKKIIIWSTRRDENDKAVLMSIYHDYDQHPMYEDLIKAYHNKETRYKHELHGEDLKNYYRSWEKTWDVPKSFKDAIYKNTSEYYQLSFWDTGMIYAFTAEPLSEENFKILDRFAKSFELTYRRFLDLQKAEAQAREAQIEGALERVRSRSLAMHKTEELGEVITVVFERLKELDFPVDEGIALITFVDGSKDMVEWMHNPDFSSAMKFHLPYFDHPVLSNFWKAKNKGDDYLVKRYTVEESRSFHSHIFKHTDYKNTPDEVKAACMAAETYSTSIAIQKNTAIFINDYSGIVLSENEVDILKRFSRVFEQAYIRFLDLKKAEEQTREAKIEVALEKIRSRTMGMHKADELHEVVTVVVERLVDLGIILDANGVILCTYFPDSKDVLHWIASPDFSFSGSYLVPYFDHPIFEAAWESRLSGADYFSKSFSVEDKNSFFEYAFEHSDYKHFPDEFKEWVFQNDKHSLSFAWTENAAILIPSHTGVVPSASEIEILKRFAKVFEQAYVRFMDLQKAEEQAALIKQEKERLEKTLQHLQATQSQLVQAEKLASLGELTAGIAHEIQNPLNFVNNFSELSVDLAEELQEEIGKLEIDGKDKEFIDELVGDLTSNQQKINHHGKRAASIVTGMLQHARTSTGTKEPTDLNALADEYLRLSYHGLRAKDSTFNAKMITDFDPSIGKVEVVPQDIGRVFLNIINNAFYATQVGATLAVAHGGEREQGDRKLGDRKGRPYEPTVSVSSKKESDHVVFKIKDNGTGIPDDVKAKIFQPFFTTKPTGQGTGLGLSLAYDIISKGHGGNLEVETKTGEGTEFIIILPTS
ncbi:MAG: ATP-binding protein [Saprospiraceae bacterium]